MKWFLQTTLLDGIVHSRGVCIFACAITRVMTDLSFQSRRWFFSVLYLSLFSAAHALRLCIYQHNNGELKHKGEFINRIPSISQSGESSINKYGQSTFRLYSGIKKSVPVEFIYVSVSLIDSPRAAKWASARHISQQQKQNFQRAHKARKRLFTWPSALGAIFLPVCTF